MRPRSEKLKQGIKTTIKAALGAALVFYVLRSNMVDFERLGGVLWRPWNLALSLVALSIVALCCAVRWQFLVRAQNLRLSLADLVSLTMIGNFFNTFMPGSVGGDLIKAWYVAGKAPQQRTRAVFTVLLDRAIGLAVIIFYAACTLLFYPEWLGSNAELRALGFSLWAFTGASIIGGFVFFSPFGWERGWLARFLNWVRRFGPLSKLVDAVLAYRNQMGAVMKALAFSTVSILVMTLLFGIQGAALGIHMPLSLYFFVVPVGLTASAIPLLPGGIGVGQVAFYTLFRWVGMPNPEQGSTLCTLMQIYVILFNCLGAVFYLRHKARPLTTGAIPDAAPKTYPL